MGLALQTVTPRSQGRVVHSDPSTSYTHDARSERPDRANEKDQFSARSRRCPDSVVPSAGPGEFLESPARAVPHQQAGESDDADDAVRAIVQPYNDDKWTINPSEGLYAECRAALGDQAAVSLRPIREDHPHFDGSNPYSVLNSSVLVSTA